MVPLHPGIQSTAAYAVLQYLLLKKQNPCISEPIQFKPVLFKGQLYISLFQSQVLRYTKYQRVKYHKIK